MSRFSKVTAFINRFKKSSPPRKFVIVFLFSAPVILFLLAASAEVTSRPAFCPTCHYMEPFYESWKNSAHNNVICVKCHFPPGLAGTVRGKIEGLVQVVNYITRSHLRRKPWAEIDDKSCMQSGCHNKRLLKGKVEFHNVLFDHSQHISEKRRGKTLRCTGCHSQIVQGDHMVVTETTCFLCHFKKSNKVDKKLYKKLSHCTTCHDWGSVPKDKMGDFRYDHTVVYENNIRCTKCHQNTIIGDGFVPKENCYTCHFDNERVAQYNNIQLIHDTHITKSKIECIQCHLKIQHKIVKLTAESELDCQACHTSAHEEQLFLFTGKSIADIDSVSNAMFKAGLNCTSCHTHHKKITDLAGVYVTNSASCESCHGKGYGEILEQWKESAEIKLRELNREINIVEGSLRRNDKEKYSKAVELVNLAKRGLHIVEFGKAVHNIKYSYYIIDECYNYLDQALKLTKSNYKIKKKITPPEKVGECYDCHTGVEEITRNVFGRQFPHKVHITDNNLDCKNCHSNEKIHGQTIINSQSCNSCHHRKSKKECGDCHKGQLEYFSGKIFGSNSPDVMFEGEVACADCHVSDGKVRKPDTKICQECHDKEYSDMADEWQTEVAGRINKINATIKSLSKIASLKNYLKPYKQKLEKIKLYSAYGIHNYELTTNLLDGIENEILKFKNPF